MRTIYFVDCSPRVHQDSRDFSLSSCVDTLIARFMGPTRGPSGAERTKVGPMLAPWTLLSGTKDPSVWKANIVTYNCMHQIKIVKMNPKKISFCNENRSIRMADFPNFSRQECATWSDVWRSLTKNVQKSWIITQNTPRIFNHMFLVSQQTYSYNFIKMHLQFFFGKIVRRPACTKKKSWIQIAI